MKGREGEEGREGGGGECQRGAARAHATCYSYVTIMCVCGRDRRMWQQRVCVCVWERSM